MKSESNWRCASCHPPDFREHGFHTGRTVDVRRADGTVTENVKYQGYDLYGKDWADVTHWRPHADLQGGST